MLDLLRIVEHIDVVLISHASLAHLGALPYAVGHLGLD
jgi:cleavage and polyadenylation specificity factor subunit 2